jgi:hypothetical protein
VPRMIHPDLNAGSCHQCRLSHGPESNARWIIGTRGCSQGGARIRAAGGRDFPDTTCNSVVRTLLYLAGTSRKVAARMTAPPRPRAVDDLAPARRALSGRAVMCCRAPTFDP